MESPYTNASCWQLGQEHSLPYPGDFSHIILLFLLERAISPSPPHLHYSNCQELGRVWHLPHLLAKMFPCHCFMNTDRTYKIQCWVKDKEEFITHSTSCSTWNLMEQGYLYRFWSCLHFVYSPRRLGKNKNKNKKTTMRSGQPVINSRHTMDTRKPSWQHLERPTSSAVTDRLC